ncbi:MAG TPA: NAD(P)/FAD-dependent oxidoreductase [Thermoplasmatales archaeon]|nr:NAD(P)/FAD-dependent oxidoreductase [Thermoplasmatales archaeon]
MEYDVAIVGAGPAGCVTALYAAKEGLKVAILEKDKEVGIPVLCGEGISKKVDQLGIIERGKWIENEVIGARIFSPNGTIVKLSSEKAGGETGYVIDREVFDKELARLAIKEGAELFLRCEATGLIRRDGEIVGVEAALSGERIGIEAKVIVGADGVESRVGKWAGINTTLKSKDIVSCFEYTLSGIECNKDYCDFFVGKTLAPGGYIWVFPKSEDVANIGIGILASYSKPGLAKELLDRFIEKHKEYKKGKPIRILTGAAPVSEPVESVKENILLVGDAARHTDPLTGGGIMHALIGGRIAGETIAKSLNEGDLGILQEYEEGWKREFGKKLKRNYMMKEIASGFDDKTFDMLADSVKDINFEEFSTLGLVKALVTKHPSLLMKLKPLIGIR